MTNGGGNGSGGASRRHGAHVVAASVPPASSPAVVDYDALLRAIEDLRVVQLADCAVSDRAPQPPRRLLLGLKATADVLGVSQSEVLKLAYKGEIATVKIGKRRLVPLDWLEKWVELMVARSEEAIAMGRVP